MADLPLLIARFGLLTLTVGLFGAASFPLYAPPADRAWAEARRASAALRIAAPAAAMICAIAWLLSLWGATQGGADRIGLAPFCLTTSSGLALSLAVLICLTLVALAFRPPLAPRTRAIVTGALILAVSAVGHASAVGGVAGAVRILVMALHLGFAGVWLGGLPPLAAALRRPGAEVEPLLQAFGDTAMACVAVLATTGLVVAAVVVNLAGGPPGPAYLTAFAIKIALVLALGLAAGVNRWRLKPLSARNVDGARRALVWTLALEQLLAVALLAAVAALGLIDPAH